MKSPTLFLIIAGAIISCNNNTDSASPEKLTSLLTSTPWLASLPQMNNETFRKGTFHFNPDGTYMEDYSSDEDKYSIAGTWQWTNSNELSVIHKSIITDEKILPLDIHGETGISRKIKIIQLTDKSLILATWLAMDPKARSSERELIFSQQNNRVDPPMHAF